MNAIPRVTVEQDQKIEDLYHEILKHWNRVSNHPIMRGIPQLQEEIKHATENLIEFRQLTRDALIK